MDIYVMGLVSCPMNKGEQDADLCLQCEHYEGHKTNLRKEGEPRLYAVCGYSGRAKVFESSETRNRATVVNGEPLPATPRDGESWTTVTR